MKILHSLLLPGLLLATAAMGAAPPAPQTEPATSPAAPPATEPAAAPAPPALSPEQQLVERLRASPAGADAVELEAGGAKVLALYRPESRGTAAGGVILLHDLGGHADWPGVIGPLRRALPGHGWATLAVQLPVPAGPGDDPAALLAQGAERLKAALAFLKDKGIARVVVAGHGAGGRIALPFAAERPAALGGLILIGMDDTGLADPAPLLEKIAVPIYDIYGSADSPEVRTAARQRAEIGQRLERQRGGGATGAGQRPRYRTFALTGADHFFSHQADTLLRRVYGWLKSHLEEAAPATTNQPNTEPS